MYKLAQILAECKNRIDKAVELVNKEKDITGRVDFQNFTELSQQVVLTQVEINRAVFREKKYGWHDTGKLPDSEGNVIVSLNGTYGNVNYMHAIAMAYYTPEDGFYDDPYMNSLIEAWRWVEPYVEVNV